MTVWGSNVRVYCEIFIFLGEVNKYYFPTPFVTAVYLVKIYRGVEE